MLSQDRVYFNNWVYQSLMGCVHACVTDAAFAIEAQGWSSIRCMYICLVDSILNNDLTSFLPWLGVAYISGQALGM